jgi:hypothetical protein
VDFRLDHAAMCLIGVTSCLALLTNGFRSLPAGPWPLAPPSASPCWNGFSPASTLPPSFAVTRRLWLLLRRGSLAAPAEPVPRRTVAAALALPFFWMSRTAIYTYYWVGHVTGAESTARLRGLDLWHSVQFIGQHLGHLHLGAAFGWCAAILTAGLGALLAIGPRRPGSGFARDWLGLALLFLTVPALILILHRQKSEYVLGVIVPGIVLLLLWLWAQLWSRLAPAPATRGRHLLRLLPAVLALAVGGGYFAQRQCWSPPDAEFLASARTVNRMADRIFDATRTLKLTHPYIGIDQIVDFIDAPILQVICYERHKVWVPFVIQLPDSILADKDEVMLYRLKLCDFVALTDEMPGEPYWPYDKQLRRLYPAFKAYCEAHLQPVETYRLFGRQMTLYQRRPQP